MKKTLLACALIPFILTLTACGGSESEPDPFANLTDPFANLTGTWQMLEEGYLIEHYYYYDAEGIRRGFTYNDEAGCFSEYTPTYKYSEPVDANYFKPYRMKNGSRAYYSNGYIRISVDGNTLRTAGGWDAEREFLKSDLELNYFYNYLCEIVNSVPVANAGVDQNVSTGDLVTLDASSSHDADGDMLSYSWTLTSLPENSSASLSDSSSALPTFTADLDGSYVAQLIVNDGTVDSVADTVSIIAETANSAPVANAGVDQSQSVHNISFTEVTLDGSASSDADGDNLTYSWSLVTKPEGSSASLTDSTSVTVNFLADLEGDYVFSLTVHDGELESEADLVTISFSTYNSRPTVNAGSNQTQFDFSEVQLDATGSDADSDILTFEWGFKSIPSGSAVSLDDTTSLTPTFIPDVYGDYVLSLIANDGFEDSLEDSVVISVKSEDEKGAYLASNVSDSSYGAKACVNSYCSIDYFIRVTNNNTQSLNWTKYEIVNGNGTIIESSTDSVLLGNDGVLSPQEQGTIRFIASNVLSPVKVRHYFTDSTNDTISFIVEEEL